MRRLGPDGNDSIQWRSSSIDISCQDSEQVLLAFRETLDSKVGALAQAGNDNPFIESDVYFYKIVGDLGASCHVQFLNNVIVMFHPPSSAGGLQDRVHVSGVMS